MTQIDGRWFVMLQGQRHGPYGSQAAALEDAIRGAQLVTNSQVLIKTADDQPRVKWTHGIDANRYGPRT
ncbi:MAG: hypothetical protein ABIW03_06275 [Sphingomicrobium sp.]